MLVIHTSARRFNETLSSFAFRKKSPAEAGLSCSMRNLEGNYFDWPPDFGAVSELGLFWFIGDDDPVLPERALPSFSRADGCCCSRGGTLRRAVAPDVPHPSEQHARGLRFSCDEYAIRNDQGIIRVIPVRRAV
jgi:hypothetical protein